MSGSRTKLSTPNSLSRASSSLADSIGATIRRSEYSLSAIDAIRVVSILDHAIKKLEFLALIASDGSMENSSGDVRKSKDADDRDPQSVAFLLEEQRLLGDRYQELSSKRSNREITMKMSLDEVKSLEQELVSIQNKLKDNTKTLTRNLKETPNESSNFKKIFMERTNLRTMLERCSREILNGLFPATKTTASSTSKFRLRNPDSRPSSQSDSFRMATNSVQIVYDNFVAAVMAEAEQKKQLEELIKLERKTTQEVKALQMKVDQEKQLKEQEIAERTVKVTALMNQLRELKNLTKEEMEKYKATMEAEFDSSRRVEKRHVVTVNSDVEHKKLQVFFEKRAHELMKQFLDERNAHLTQEADFWYKKQDKEIADIKNEQTAMEDKRAKQIKLLEDLQERHKIETQEKEEREAKDAKLAEEERQKKEEQTKECITKIILTYKVIRAKMMYEQMKIDRQKAKEEAEAAALAAANTKKRR